jgi:hypothetical protein|tara:strand:- start:6443 stop:6655 length:213 start_codon:yes stop_codon:yes gene_type:complete
MRAFAFLLLLLLGVARAEAAVTYVKPHWSLVSEWSPASDRAAAAAAHSAAMQKYSQALEDNPQMKPCVYC